MMPRDEDELGAPPIVAFFVAVVLLACLLMVACFAVGVGIWWLRWLGGF